jgi:UDP-N-acetyl-D-galactosamine dehydrogenase
MGPYIARRTVQLLTQHGKDPGKSRALVMGATFKENVSDIRNSKVIDLVNELKQFSVKVEVVDPYASGEEMMHEYKTSLTEGISGHYDAIIVAVGHRQYAELDESYFLSISTPGAVFTDVKGIFRNRIKKLNYWSL